MLSKLSTRASAIGEVYVYAHLVSGPSKLLQKGYQRPFLMATTLKSQQTVKYAIR